MATTENAIAHPPFFIVIGSFLGLTDDLREFVAQPFNTSSIKVYVVNLDVILWDEFDLLFTFVIQKVVISNKLNG